jgi:preprotein translocase subunit YajC
LIGQGLETGARAPHIKICNYRDDFMTTISILSAAADAGGAGSFLISVMPLVLIFAVFYFLLIRPQQKKMKEHQAKVGSVKKNDEVVTGGGLVGKAVKVDDEYVEVEIASGVRVKAVKATLTDVMPRGGAKPAND